MNSWCLLTFCECTENKITVVYTLHRKFESAPDNDMHVHDPKFIIGATILWEAIKVQFNEVVPLQLLIF